MVYCSITILIPIYLFNKTSVNPIIFAKGRCPVGHIQVARVLDPRLLRILRKILAHAYELRKMFNGFKETDSVHR